MGAAAWRLAAGLLRSSSPCAMACLLGLHQHAALPSPCVLPAEPRHPCLPPPPPQGGGRHAAQQLRGGRRPGGRLPHQGAARGPVGGRPAAAERPLQNGRQVRGCCLGLEGRASRLPPASASSLGTCPARPGHLPSSSSAVFPLTESPAPPPLWPFPPSCRVGIEVKDDSAHTNASGGFDATGQTGAYVYMAPEMLLGGQCECLPRGPPGRAWGAGQRAPGGAPGPRSPRRSPTPHPLSLLVHPRRQREGRLLLLWHGALRAAAPQDGAWRD